MVIVTAFAVVQEGRIEEAKAVSAAVIAETENEDGCLRYRFYQDLLNPEHFHAYEEWESEEALYAHLQRPHVQAFFAAITPLLVEPPVITRHQVASSGPL